MNSKPYFGGFLIGLTSVRPNTHAASTWTYGEEDGIFWHVEPSLELQVYRGDRRKVIIFGPHFSIGNQSDFFDRLTACNLSDYYPMLDDLSGRFCIVRIEGGEIFATKDAFGSRATFYSPSTNGLIASHAELLATAVGSEKDDQMAALKASYFYKSLNVKYLPGNRTMFSDVRGIPTNTELNFNSGEILRFWPRSHLVQHDDAQRVDARMQDYFAELRKFCAPHKTFVGMTGGVDTRFLTAGLIANFGQDPRSLDLRGMIWLGGYSSPEEREVAGSLALAAEIPVTLVDLPDEAGAVGKVANRNSGLIRGPSRLSAGIHKATGEAGDSIFLVGYGGEIIRGFFNLQQTPISGADAQSFTDAYMSRSRAKGLYEDDFDPRDIIVSAFSEFLVSSGMQIAVDAGYDVNDIFYWEHRMGNWGALMLDELGSASYCMAGINDRKLYELCLGLPRKTRLSKTLLKTRIDEWVPHWSKYPLV